MGTFSFCWMLLVLQLLVLQLRQTNASINFNKSQTYIIHLDNSHKPSPFPNHESWHRNMVKSLTLVCPKDKDAFLVYSYTHATHGFSAKLTPCQLTEAEKSPAHLTTHKESFGQMFTTHTPKFLGLNRSFGIWPTASYGKDVIIGVVDTGIWPESESFKDDGMSSIPSGWKGRCENGTAFTKSLCNNKLIGAQSFSKGLIAAGLNGSSDNDFDSPRDANGHGTHTSSTAAGNFVCGVSHFGYAKGVAIGIAPRAHLASYKVIWNAFDAPASSVATDILAGMDQAISDGVDVMSISLGIQEQPPLYQDVIAIASFSAIEKGIVVVCAAGNTGPHSSTIYNGAPWIMTVGAGTIDRSYVATLELGNGLTFQGTSYFPSSVSITNTEIYYEHSNPNKSGCLSLDRNEIIGKVVLCDDSGNSDITEKMNVVTLAGAYAVIFLTSDSLSLIPEEYSIPMICLHIRFAKELKEYSSKGNNAFVKEMRFVFTETGTGPAPQVADLSSRGPDPVTPNNVLKPDILAPGIDVLGAVRPGVFMMANHYNVVTDYALYRGTSMATPHVAGVAALVKAVHRDWSPAAIRSAIMTTATIVDNTGTTIKDQANGLVATPLDYGAGHVNPNRAMDPGLIFDLGSQDYIDFLCGHGYTDKQMMTVIRKSRWVCNENKTDLNYPSFIVSFSNKSTFPFEKHFTRTVTNVGEPTSSYRAIVEVPDGMIVRVEPNTMQFTSEYQKQKFVLSLQVDGNAAPKVKYGYLKWVDGHNHIVSSPIVVTIQ